MLQEINSFGSAAVATPESDSTLEYWERCKATLQEKIPAPFYNSFISPITVDSAPGSQQFSNEIASQLLLTVKDKKHLNHIQARYFPLIEETLRKASFQGQVSLMVSGESPVARFREPKEQPEPVRESRSGLSLPDTTEEFYPHTANRFAVEQLLKLSFPATTAFISGPSGSGKSTLLKNIVREARRHNCSVAYHSLESFLTQFSIACSKKETLNWRNKLRSHQLLIIDDFQFIKSTARKSQEELRYIIDDFQRMGHRLILASDTEPNHLPLQSDLRSRLFLAFKCQLFWAEREDRQNVLRADLLRFNLKADESLVRYLAGRIGGDMRRLKSVALRLINLGHTVDLSVMEPSALDEYLSDLYDVTHDIDPKKIISKVAEFYRIPTAALIGPARDKNLVLARHLAIYLCTQLTPLKYSTIATLVGRKKHASVTHGCRKIEDLLKKDLFFEQQINRLKAELTQAI